MAKFKVGDKVRVRRDLKIGWSYGEWCFSFYMNSYKGDISIVENIVNGKYKLKRIPYEWTDEMLEEVKEDKMGKTFREVIADIKEGEVWESIQDCFQLKEVSCLEGRILFKFEGVFIDKTGSRIDVDTGVGNGQTFKLQRKEYTFEEAFKAYEEGKEIESLKSKCRYKKENGKDTFIFLADWTGCDSIDLNEIRGKWYIN